MLVLISSSSAPPPTRFSTPSAPPQATGTPRPPRPSASASRATSAGPPCSAYTPRYRSRPSAVATAPGPGDNTSTRFLGVEAKTLLYTRLTDILSKEALFYAVIFPFIAFFGAFAYVLYPMRDAIHPTALDDRLLASLGPSFLGSVAILRVWSFYLFYVMNELWGSIVISVLFWGFAN